ncbi:rod shape-determining protein RodA [Patescibacteria group bacterium]|nr:rod shape-determining protein RodA [Patescibacteria group bacterium]
MFFSHLKKLDWGLILPVFLLTSLGLLSIYSSSLGAGNFLNFKKQIIFFAISIFLVIFLSFFDLRFLKINPYLVLSLYFLSLLSLGGLFLLGTEVRGVKGWYKAGIFSFDPIPFGAIILIIVLSKYFSTRHIEIQRFQPILVSGLYAAIPIGLILFQPDLGSCLSLIAVWLGMILFSGIKIRHFLILILVFLLIMSISWSFWLKDYQKQRIVSFLNPNIDPQGTSWNVNQSKIAIGAGGFFGRGIGKGSQTQYGFLPEPQTDFIFSAIAEETGFLMISILVFGFLILFWRIIKVALTTSNNFSRLFASGFAFLLISQTFINIGMALGILPIVGLPLPLVSYGGSQLLAFYFGLGILVSLQKRA